MQKEVADIQIVKKNNMKVVLNCIREEKAISRASIAKRTCLTRATVSSLVEELIQKRVVEEIGEGESNGGRKPILLKVRENGHLAIGIDLADVNVIRGYLCNMESVVLAKIECSFENDFESIQKTISYIIEYLLGVAKSRGTVEGIGIGVAALVNPLKRDVLFSTNFDINGMELFEYLSDKFKLPVYLQNESNAAVWAEKEYGVGEGFKNVLYVSIGKGIGSGIVINGSIYYGGFFGAGEIGHIMVEPEGRKCSCGASGCLETLIGQERLLERIKIRFQKDLVISEVVDGYLCRDEKVRDIVNEMAVYLGKAMAVASNLLNMELIVLGGYITRYGNDFLALVKSTFMEHIISFYRDKISIVYSKFGFDAVGIGGASLVLKGIWDLDII